MGGYHHLQKESFMYYRQGRASNRLTIRCSHMSVLMRIPVVFVLYYESWGWQPHIGSRRGHSPMLLRTWWLIVCVIHILPCLFHGTFHTFPCWPRLRVSMQSFLYNWIEGRTGIHRYQNSRDPLWTTLKITKIKLSGNNFQLKTPSPRTKNLISNQTTITLPITIPTNNNKNLTPRKRKTFPSHFNFSYSPSSGLTPARTSWSRKFPLFYTHERMSRRRHASLTRHIFLPEQRNLPFWRRRRGGRRGPRRSGSCF